MQNGEDEASFHWIQTCNCCRGNGNGGAHVCTKWVVWLPPHMLPKKGMGCSGHQGSGLQLQVPLFITDLLFR